MDIENDLEFLYKNQPLDADSGSESGSGSDGESILASKAKLGVPKTKRITKRPKTGKRKPRLNIDFEEDEEEPEQSEKLKELETN